MGFIPATGLFFLVLSNGLALASVTHRAEVEMELSLQDSKGKDHRISDHLGDFTLDWTTRQCSVRRSDLSFPCTLETSEELHDREGNILMKELPLVRFGVKVLDSMFFALAAEDSDIARVIGQIVRDTDSEHESGMLLPFYTCEGCTRNGGATVPVWNAYDSFVKRTLELHHPLLQGKSLVLKLRISRMKAEKRAISIIGRANADTYIP
jgi:hypothetical protein